MYNKSEESPRFSCEASLDPLIIPFLLKDLEFEFFRCPPDAITNTGSPSARKINELAICPTSIPSAPAASTAVRALSSSRRTWPLTPRWASAVRTVMTDCCSADSVMRGRLATQLVGDPRRFWSQGARGRPLVTGHP